MPAGSTANDGGCGESLRFGPTPLCESPCHFNPIAVKIFVTFLLGLMTSLGSGIVQPLTAESIPKNPETAMGFSKSAEQLGLFVGPITGKALIPVVGIACKIFVCGTIPIMGSLIFAMTVREPPGLQ